MSIDHFSHTYGPIGGNIVNDHLCDILRNVSFNTVVKIDFDKAYLVQNEITKWCNDNNIITKQFNPQFWLFNDIDSAILFYLTWD